MYMHKYIFYIYTYIFTHIYLINIFYRIFYRIYRLHILKIKINISIFFKKITLVLSNT